MKKAEKLFSVLLMVAMLVTSAGLLYASLYASGSGTQSTFSSVVFEKETGIRYNNLTKEFEVFNEAGVSWIASNRYISVDGTVDITSHSGDNNWAQASGNQTYNIMRDIGYTGTLSGQSHYNSGFDTSKITLGASGVLDGRGFTLKGFNVKVISLEGKLIGSALVATNAGIIRNLNISNVDVNIGAAAGDMAGILCGVNKGVIDSCTIYGTDQNNTYTTTLFTGLYGIAGINMNRITNSINNASLVNNSASESYAAGISSVADNMDNPTSAPYLLNNINNGSIKATNGRAAGIAIDTVGIEFTARGNTNNGDINAALTVSGIIDGGADLKYLTARDNKLNGALDGQGTAYPLYYGVIEDNGVVTPQPMDYGIRYNASLNSNRGGFEIFNIDGLSWMCYGAWFNSSGQKLNEGDAGAYQATSAAYYKINENVTEINYSDKTKLYNKQFNGGTDGTAPSLTGDGIFHGGDVPLVGFPVRKVSSSSNDYSALFATVPSTASTSLRLLNIKLNVFTPSYSGSIDYVGGIVARIVGSVRILDCNVTGTINFGSSGTIGGIVGFVSMATILDYSGCRVELTIRGSNIGGIVGLGSTGSMPQDMGVGTNLYVEGNFSGYIVGGIGGNLKQISHVFSSPFTIKGVFTGNYVGYFSGRSIIWSSLPARESFVNSTIDVSLIGTNTGDGYTGQYEQMSF